MHFARCTVANHRVSLAAAALDLIHPHHYDDDWLPIYSSTKLLQRCQSVMQYNVSSLVYETGAQQHVGAIQHRR